MISALSGVTGWVLFGGLVVTTGAVTTRWIVLPRAGSGHDQRLDAGTARFGTAGAVVLVVGMALYFVRQLVEFRDPFSPWADEASLLLSTAWGRTWLRAAVGSVVLLGAFAVARRRSGGWWVATPLTLALGAFPGLTGHAAGAERLRSLFLLADAVHVWAAGAWIGGLAAVLWLERDTRRRSPGTSLLPGLVRAFSPVAMAAVASLLLTGALATWEHLPSPAAFFTMGWGRLLLAKLAMVGVVLALGARNHRILTPGLGTQHGDAAMRRSALLELAVAQVVLILTALLVRTSPMDG